MKNKLFSVILTSFLLCWIVPTFAFQESDITEQIEFLQKEVGNLLQNSNGKLDQIRLATIKALAKKLEKKVSHEIRHTEKALSKELDQVNETSEKKVESLQKKIERLKEILETIQKLKDSYINK